MLNTLAIFTQLTVPPVIYEVVSLETLQPAYLPPILRHRLNYFAEVEAIKSAWQENAN